MLLVRYFSAFLLLLFVTSQFSPAQKIFRDGYIERKDNMVLEGLTGFTPGQTSPSVCVFKRFEIAIPVSYQPGDIKAFGYRNGSRFESFNFEGKSLYYETLVKGELSLYRKGNRYFLKVRENVPFELNNKMSFQDNGQSKEFTSINAVLLYLFSGKGIEVPKTINPKYDLVALLADYNKISAKGYAVYQDVYTEKELVANVSRSEVNKNTFGILGGTNGYFQSVSTQYTKFFPGSVSQFAPTFGLFYERVISRRSDKFSVRAEVLYTQHSFYSYTEKVYPNAGIGRNDMFIDNASVKVPVLLQYSMRGSRLVPYINAGFSYSSYLKNKYLHIYEFEDNFHSITTTEDNKINLNSSEITPVLGAGLSMRAVNMISIRFEGRVEYGSGLIAKAQAEKIDYVQSSLQVTLLFGISF